MGGGASLPSDVDLTHLFTDLVKSYGFLFFFLSPTVMGELVLRALLLALARELTSLPTLTARHYVHILIIFVAMAV